MRILSSPSEQEKPLFSRRHDTSDVRPVLSHDAVETVIKAVVGNVGIESNFIAVRNFEDLPPSVIEQATKEGSTEEIQAAYFDDSICEELVGVTHRR